MKKLIALLVLAGLFISIGVVGLINTSSAQLQTGVQPQPNVPTFQQRQMRNKMILTL